MSQTTINAAISRFEENENRVDIFVNQEGFYQTNTSPVKNVETLPSFIARMIQRYITLNFKGEWATGTAYQVNELVKESAVMYICVEDHTSGTFTTDLIAGKWAVYQGVAGPDLESIEEGYGVDLVGRALKTLFEVDDLNTTSPSVHSHVYVRCFETLFDDGHGSFDWNETSEETPIRGMIHQVTGLATGRWIRQIPTPWVTLEMFGGKGDDSFDNTPVWAAVIAAYTTPCIQVGKGIYQGTINCGTKTVKIRGMGGSSSWDYGTKPTVLKNNSVSTRLISFGASEYSELRDLTLDNNGVPAETCYAYQAYFFNIDEVGFINQGSNNATMNGKYALHMERGTLSRIGRIFFRRNYFGASSLYGGNLYFAYINYPQIGHIGGTEGSTAGGIGYYFYTLIGGDIGTLEMDGSYYGNMMRFDQCYSVDIQNINFEISDLQPAATTPYVYFANSRNVHVASARIWNQFGTYSNPLIGLYRNHGLSLDNFEYGRTVNDSTTPIVKWFDWNYRTTIKNVYGENWDTIDATNPVSHTFIDTNEAQVTTESEVVVLENYRSKTAGVTHKLTNVQRVSCRNVDGTITADDGAVIENSDTMPLLATAVSVTGQNSPFQDITKSTISGTLSGGSATIAVSIPANSQILGVSFRIDTAVTGSTGWNAAFSGGNTTAILNGGTQTKNNKFYIPFSTNLLTTATTNIALLATGGSWTGGNIRAVVYYRKFNALPDAP